jgi:hypothetical protein
MENYSHYLQRYADRLLEDGGEHAIVEAVEDLAEDGGVATRAPVEFDDLRRSGHPTVTSDGATIYDRAPRQHRLSEEELRIKDRLRVLPPALIGYLWWRVMHHSEPPSHLR